MLTKEEWKKIARKSKICTILALALLFLGLGLYYTIRLYCSIFCILFFTSGLLFGLSTLDKRLIKEYEENTGEEW